MDYLLYASFLNEEGASAVSANNTAEAFQFFCNALEVLLVGVPHGTEIMGNCPDVAKAASSLLEDSHQYHALLSVDIGEPEQAAPRSFRKPFVFRPNEDSDRDMALKTRTYISMVFYNLASTFQKTGDSTHRYSSEQALTIALKLYDVGFDLLIQEERCCVDDCSTNISLAILNNMAEAHWTLCDFDRASRVLELQKGLLDIIVSNKRSHSFSEEELELFIMNTHLLQAPSGAAAAWWNFPVPFARQNASDFITFFI